MRRLIVEEWISLDGYASGRDGKLDFFSNKVRDTYTDEYHLKFLETIDCILLGRKTYEEFVNLWPDRPIDNDMLADKMNRAQKIIFSNTLSDAPWGKWQKAEIETGNPVSKLKRMKSLQGKNIVLWGSISLAQNLMKENLVDEYHIHLCPALTGGGRKFFSEDMNPLALNLIETKHYTSGVVFLNYQPL